MPAQDGKKTLDLTTLESEFEEFLEEKGYNLDAKIDMEQDLDTNDAAYVPVKRKPIRKISEELNERAWDFDIYADTRRIMPGMVVYVVEHIAPTEKIPYVTYRPSARIITEVQDNGVNNGTVFLTYCPKVVSVPTYHSAQHSEPQIISEHEVIYSPLLKDHAKYICKLLNLQSKQMYREYVKKNQTQR